MAMSTVKSLARRLLRTCVRLIPESVLIRVLPTAEKFDSSAVQQPTPALEGSVRLFIGPTNTAGQAWHWARAAERLPGVSARSMAAARAARRFEFDVDQLVPAAIYRWSSSWQRAQLDSLRSFSHVMIESARPLLGDAFGRNFKSDLVALKAASVSVALIFHGSDIRLPSRHAAASQWSPFADASNLTTALEQRVRAHQRLLEGVDVPIFVSTPDLLLDLPAARWLPVVVDPETWKSDSAPFEHSGLPRVAHAPSQAVLKGSDLIDPILSQLEEEGILQYERVEQVPVGEMPSLYRNADIVIDQARLGIYGVAACEAMAAGRVVVSHVSEQIRSHVFQETGITLPIVEAKPDVLASTIRAIVRRPAAYLPQATAGIGFVNAVHDGRLAAKALREFLGR